ncbi:MAG: hypothetical protein PHY29_02900 [Syntrophales bacterium]|nr:hypothetical protein [Syntrophales bacterium]
MIMALLDTAREAIDGKMNCNTPEYEALDNLERAMRLFVDKLERAERTWRESVTEGR